MSKLKAALLDVLSAPRHMGRDLWILFASFFLWCFGQGLFLYTWPLFMQDLGASPVQIGSLFAVANLTMAVTHVAGGFLADRFDRKAVMVASWIISVPAALVFAWARRWTDLFPGMVMQYWFMGMPAFNAYVATQTRPETRASAFSVVYASGPLGMLIAPALGGWLGQLLGMRVVFLIAFGVYVAATAVMIPLRPQHPQRLAATRAGSGSQDRAMTARGAAGGDGVAAAAGAGRPAPPHLLQVGAYFALAALAYFLLLAAVPYIPTFLRAQHGMTVVHIGALGSLAAGSELVLSLALGGVGDRWGKPPTLAVALALFGLGLACLLPGGVAMVVLAFALRGSGRVVQSLLTAMVSDVSPQHALGKGFGAFGAVTGLAMVAAPYVGGWIYGLSPLGLFAGLASASLALGALVAALARRWSPRTLPAAVVR